MKVIAISGKAQHGKTTAAEFMKPILEKNGYSTLIIHYGDLLKYICKSFFDWDGKKDESGRSLLQYVGTEIIRKQDSDYWVKFVEQMLTFFPDRWDYVLIPDCRFPNEIDRLKQAGFDVVHIRIVRPVESGLTDAQQTHSSETALDDKFPDYGIFNAGSLDELRTACERLLIEINKA